MATETLTGFARLNNTHRKIISGAMGHSDKYIYQEIQNLFSTQKNQILYREWDLHLNIFFGGQVSRHFGMFFSTGGGLTSMHSLYDFFFVLKIDF